MPEYMKRCLKVIKNNPEIAEKVRKGLNGKKDFSKGIYRNAKIRLHSLKTISVKTYCNFCNHASHKTIREMIEYLDAQVH